MSNKKIVLDTNIYRYIGADTNAYNNLDNFLESNKLSHVANTISIYELINQLECDKCNNSEIANIKNSLNIINNDCNEYLEDVRSFLKMKFPIESSIEISDVKTDLKNYLRNRNNKDILNNIKLILGFASPFINNVSIAAQAMYKLDKDFKKNFDNQKFRNKILNGLIFKFFGLSKKVKKQYKDIYEKPIFKFFYWYYCDLLECYCENGSTKGSNREDWFLSVYLDDNNTFILTRDEKFYNRIKRVSDKSGVDYITRTILVKNIDLSDLKGKII